MTAPARLAPVLCVLLAACGGGKPPAESAEGVASEAVEPADPPAAETPAGDEPAASESATGEKAPSAGEVTGGDVPAILQLVIDDPELDSHLHLGTAGRFPLQISGERLPPDLKLVKSTEPVKIVEAPKSKKDAVLVFTEIDVQGSKATVRYRYDVEGIRGTVTLAKRAHGWELVNSRLVEH